MASIPQRNRNALDTAFDLVQEFASLWRKEIRLARTEIAQKVNVVTAGVGLICSGLALALAGLVVLLQAAVAALIAYAGLRPAVSAAIVGGAVVLLSIALFAIGKSRMNPKNLSPDKTIEQPKRDFAVVKSQVTR